MQYKIALHKMITADAETIQYYLKSAQDIIHINALIGKELRISFNKYRCNACAKNKKLFRQGFCYDCFYETAQTGDWIMKPELSTAHLGIEDRDLTYEKEVQLKPHIVYLALSSGVKVGVTRKTQIPTRWIDQGATQALVLVEVPNRYLAGIAEVALKDFVSDKTSWQKMLKNEIVKADLFTKRDELLVHLPQEVQEYIVANPKLHTFNFPITNYPTKVKSLKLDKENSFSGKLIGIKGQYLLFEDGTVFNVRSHEGFVVDWVF
jgi:hypothetical protein